MSTPPEAPASATPAVCTLDTLRKGDEAKVLGVRATQPEMTEELQRRLVEIGFLRGEHVRVIARGIPGGSPIAVRVGTSTFALRKIEAQSIEVAVEPRQRA